jgi:hypothetical protein
MKTVAATLALACVMNAQSANPLSAEASQVYASVKNNILRSAEKMPEENYGFKPAPRDAAYDGLTDRAAVEMIKVGAAEHAKLRMLWVNTVHDNSHYGNLVTYLRIKGLAPSTEGQ